MGAGHTGLPLPRVGVTRGGGGPVGDGQAQRAAVFPPGGGRWEGEGQEEPGARVSCPEVRGKTAAWAA